MSSMNPSALETFRKLIGPPEGTILAFYYGKIKKRWIERYYNSLADNNVESNDITQNSNVDVETNPFDEPVQTICQLNAKEYKLDELMARIEGNFIVIEGGLGEKIDESGFVSTQFTRKVAIPADKIEDEIKVQLFSDGMLSITANKWPETLEISINPTKLELQKNRKEHQMMYAEEHSKGTNFEETQHIKEDKIQYQISSVAIST